MSSFSDDDLLARNAELTMLFDCYGDLLAEKQRMYLTLHLQEDWTLAEIADEHAVSRQAVYDQVKRAEQLLLQYEEKLQLLAKHQARQKLYEDLMKQLERANVSKTVESLVEAWLLQLKQQD